MPPRAARTRGPERPGRPHLLRARRSGETILAPRPDSTAASLPEETSSSLGRGSEARCREPSSGLDHRSLRIGRLDVADDRFVCVQHHRECVGSLRRTLRIEPDPCNRAGATELGIRLPLNRKWHVRFHLEAGADEYGSEPIAWDARIGTIPKLGCVARHERRRSGERVQRVLHARSDALAEPVEDTAARQAERQCLRLAPKSAPKRRARALPTRSSNDGKLEASCCSNG